MLQRTSYTIRAWTPGLFARSFVERLRTHDVPEPGQQSPNPWWCLPPGEGMSNRTLNKEACYLPISIPYGNAT
jgi:hypothetical protein